MKKTLVFLLLSLATVLAQATCASGYVCINVLYTSGAKSYFGSDAATVQAIQDAVVAINTSYANSGINYNLLVGVSAAVGAPSDSLPMSSQFVWEQTNQNAWASRYTSDASMGIIVSAPGAGVDGLVPSSTPTRTQDATAAVNAAALQTQLEIATSRIIGATLASGVTTRARTYPGDPINGGANVCFHTKTAAPSSPSIIVPYLSGWVTGGLNPTTLYSDLGSSCDLWRKYGLSQPGAVPNDWSRSAISGGVCQVYSTTGTPTHSASYAYYTPSGAGSVISCTDVELPTYSSATGTPYLGFATGSASQDAVGLMNGPSNARLSTVLGFANANGSLYASAKAGFFTSIINFFNSF